MAFNSEFVFAKGYSNGYEKDMKMVLTEIGGRI